ncbi:hypothetical protein TNCT_661731 [Trichonephila clavata]|uniref:Uncharacterized protein n=1 Tax=Trichonephila clavata TaxID=2740835 RepID=A0A8X6L4D9_TRICU|nr:hypothetical protein TNCT_661731 [Trichonephila clavata]
MWESVEKKGVVFIWKIENYSFGWHTETEIYSPWFKVMEYKESKCRLRLKNDYKEIKIVCIKHEGFEYSLLYDIYLFNSAGLPESKSSKILNNYSTGGPFSIESEKVLNLRRHDYLPQDTP